jgi:hypothetical protein
VRPRVAGPRGAYCTEPCAGGDVAIHPMLVRSPLAASRGVALYQVARDAAGLHIARSNAPISEKMS